MARPNAAASPPSADLEDLILELRHKFVDYLIGELRRHGLQRDAEDVLQDALGTVLREWDRWPADPDLRRAWAWNAIKFAAREAIKRHYRHERIARVELCDMADTGDTTLAEREHQALKLGIDISRAAISDSGNRDFAERYATRASLLAAISVLTPIEQAVLLRGAVDGESRTTLAADLGMSVDQLDAILFRSRQIVRLIVRHADGNNVSDEEAELLWAMLDNRLQGREAKIFRRHYTACTTCQRLARIHADVDRAGRQLVIGLPGFLFALPRPGGGAPVGGGAASASGAPSSAAGVGVGAASGGAGAKVAVALTVAGVGLGGVGAGVLAHLRGYDAALTSRTPSHVTHSALGASQATRSVDRLAAARAAALVSDVAPARTRVPKRRAGRPSPSPTPRLASSAAATVAAAPPATQSPTSPTSAAGGSSAAPAASSGAPSGGEFVVGSH
jgi:RNA polymerase sigma factor (sigma-70 family)